MKLTDMLALSHVPRWSIIARQMEQNVGDHTFRVLVIAVEIAERTGTPLTTTDILKVLYHDGHESWTADVPSPLKRDIEDSGFNMLRVVPWAKNLPLWSDIDAEAVFRIADKIEAYTFIQRWGLGPQAAKVAAGCYASIFDEIGGRTSWIPHVQGILADINDETERGFTYTR